MAFIRTPYAMNILQSVELQEQQAQTTFVAKQAAFEQNTKLLLASLKDKESASTLAEEINNSNGTGASIIVLNRDGDVVLVTNKFYLGSMSISLKEKVQMMESFNSSNITFFGNSVKVYGFSGIALDAASTDPNAPYQYFHQSSLLKMFDTELRGARLVEQDHIAVIKVANHTIYGYPLNMQVDYDSNADKMARFNMTWLVTEHALNLPGVVSEDNLKNMFSNVSSVAETYLKEIDRMVGAINGLIYLRNWEKADQLRLVLGDVGLNSFTFENLRALPQKEMEVVRDQAVDQINSFIENIQTLTSKEGANTSVLFQQIMGVDPTWDTKLIIAITNMFTNPYSFEHVSTFVSKMLILKNNLLTFQARLV